MNQEFLKTNIINSIWTRIPPNGFLPSLCILQSSKQIEVTEATSLGYRADVQEFPNEDFLEFVVMMQ